MDSRLFDALARSLTEHGTRRGLLGLLSTIPVPGGLFALLDSDETDAKGRRKRRKKRHKHGKGRHRKHKKKCKPHAKDKTCNGKCGPIKNHCKKTVDCGSCACVPGSCENPTPLCVDGVCTACTSSDQCPANTICDDGSCLACDVCDGCTYSTVQAAVADGSGPSTIRICPGDYIGDISIERALTLIGAGEGENPSVDTILQGTGATSVMTITDNNQDVTLRQLRITGGSSGSGGGINHAGGQLTMTACTVNDNAASGNTFSSFGGGIFNSEGSTADLTDCTISDNDCTGDANGGGIANQGAMTLTDCLVSGNTAARDAFGGGGLINMASGTLTLDRTIVRQNHASQGGGILNTIGTLRVTNGSSITGNTTTPTGRGAGIFSFGDGTFLDASSVTENTAADSDIPGFFSEGGGIYNSAGTVHLANGASIANNVAQTFPNCGGGGIYDGEGCAP